MADFNHCGIECGESEIPHQHTEEEVAAYMKRKKADLAEKIIKTLKDHGFMDGFEDGWEQEAFKNYIRRVLKDQKTVTFKCSDHGIMPQGCWICAKDDKLRRLIDAGDVGA